MDVGSRQEEAVAFVHGYKVIEDPDLLAQDVLLSVRGVATEGAIERAESGCQRKTYQ
jgi:hypothetical protein